MFEPAPSWSASDPYERACDQAIAMCGGNMRSTIKVLIMANDYLEMELRELQTAALSGDALPQGGDEAA